MNIRVTQKAMSRQYNKNMNSTLNRMSYLNNQVISKRKFLRASEDPIAAAKAIAIRKNLSNLDMYKDNLNSAKGIFNTAEGSLKTVVSEISTVTKKIEEAITGSRSQEDRDIIAAELEGIAQDMIKDMNLEFGDRNLFGGTNNSSKAFKYDETTGIVSYNGKAVSTNTTTYKSGGDFYYGGEDVTANIITNESGTAATSLDPAQTYYIDRNQIISSKDAAGVVTYSIKHPVSGVVTDITAEVKSGNLVISDELVKMDDGKTYKAPEKISLEQSGSINSKTFPGTKSILIDVGKGIEYDENGAVDPSTAMDIALNGAELIGCGTDEDGDSNNIIQLTFDAAKALRENDVSTARDLMDKITAAKSTLLIGITNLGVKEKAIEYSLDKISTDEISLAEAQTETEGMSLEAQAAAMTEYKMAEAAYNATLQMGSKVIPTSLFDFIR